MLGIVDQALLTIISSNEMQVIQDWSRSLAIVISCTRRSYVLTCLRCAKRCTRMIYALLLLKVLLTADSYSLYTEIGFMCGLISSELKRGRFVPRVH